MAPETSDFKPVAADSDGAKPWTVHRQDDNGNVFVLGRYSTQPEASAVARRFEARGHKQMYWVSGPEGGRPEA